MKMMKIVGLNYNNVDIYTKTEREFPNICPWYNF